MHVSLFILQISFKAKMGLNKQNEAKAFQQSYNNFVHCYKSPSLDCIMHLIITARLSLVIHNTNIKDEIMLIY